MARELFVDTSGFFAIVVSRDPQHAVAKKLLQEAGLQKRRLITPDYVLDETATLLKARGDARLVQPLLDRVFRSNACRVEWTSESRFLSVTGFFEKHVDQAWSFTDCLSFVVMKEQRVREAVTTDAHFEQAGFVALLK